MSRKVPPQGTCPPRNGGPDGEPTTLEEAVDDYIHCYRARGDQEARFFRQLGSIEEAIRVAALCLRPDGKRQDHQHRIPAEALAEGERNLQASKPEIASSEDFRQLHAIVGRELLGIHGIGRLTGYDVAFRIGLYLDHEPKVVYLHAGTAEGARALGLDHRADHLDPDAFPSAFRRLRPREIEDCLCIYKANLLAMRISPQTN